MTLLEIGTYAIDGKSRPTLVGSELVTGVLEMSTASEVERVV